MLNQNDGISGTHNSSGRDQRLLDKWQGALWRVVHWKPLFSGSPQLYFYSWQICFNMDQKNITIFPKKENLCLCSRLSILCGSLVPHRKQLQSLFWVLSQDGNMPLRSIWGLLNGLAEQQNSPSLSSFYSSTDSCHTRYLSPTFPSLAVSCTAEPQLIPPALTA